MARCVCTPRPNTYLVETSVTVVAVGTWYLRWGLHAQRVPRHERWREHFDSAEVREAGANQWQGNAKRSWRVGLV